MIIKPQFKTKTTQQQITLVPGWSVHFGHDTGEATFFDENRKELSSFQLRFTTITFLEAMQLLAASHGLGINEESIKLPDLGKTCGIVLEFVTV